MRTLVLALTAAVALQPPPTFQSATDVVEVDIVAQDRNGAFVTDLGPDDFDVREDGALQHVDIMYFVDANTRRPVPAPPPADAASARAAARPPAAAAAPTSPRVFIAFFDDEHLTPAGFKRVQAGAMTLFSKVFAKGDIGGVVTNGHLAHDRLTTDREELLAAVRDARPGRHLGSRRLDEMTWPRLSETEAMRIVFYKDDEVERLVVQRACADDVSQCQLAGTMIGAKARTIVGEVQADTTKTTQTLSVLLRGLTRFDGRKTILLLTEGFLADTSWPLVRDAIGEAARADARIYALDARGLDRMGMSAYLTGAFPADGGYLALLKQFDFSEDAMNSLAVDTGGFVVRNYNYFDNAVSQIVADASTYYVLGYRPSKAPDGKYRSISVKVKRPGVLVRARRGYVATAKPLPAVTAAEAAPIPAATSASNGEPIRARPGAEEHVIALGPTTTDEDAAAGWRAYQRGDVDAAEQSLSIAASRPGAASWVSYALGQSEFALDHFDRAVAAWQRVQTAAPQFEPVYFDLVDGYLRLKQYDKAVRLLETARKRWPRDVEVLNALGVVQTILGALDEAIAAFEEAIATAPADAVAYFNAAKAHELQYARFKRSASVNATASWMANGNDRNIAIADYTKYLELAPQGPFAESAREGLTRLGAK